MALYKIDKYYYFFNCPRYSIPKGELIKANCKTPPVSQLVEKFGGRLPKEWQKQTELKR